MYNVLIASLENWDTLAEMPSILKKGGCTVDILCSNNEWLKANSYHRHWIESEKEPDGYASQLISLVQQNSYDWVILGDEPLIKLMNDKIEDEELFKKILPLTKIENRQILSSKAGLSEFCEKHQIISPKFIVHKGSSNINELGTDLNFPVIIKKDLSWGGSGVMVCDNFDQLFQQVRNISNDETVIIQEYIKGREIPVEALFSKGELVSFTVSEILSHDKDQFSYSTRRNYFGNKGLEKMLTILGEKMGINGFANLAYIYSSENNNYYLIEADLRPNSWMTGKHVRNVFINGIKRIAALISAKHRPIFTLSKNKIEVALFYKDIRRCLYSRDRKGLMRWIANYRYWQFIPLYDRQLLVKITNELSKEFFNNKISKLSKYKAKTFTLLRPQTYLSFKKAA
ncbi:MAG TPA: ATP-grasp domain-containing protein [Flavisolibacter sp.]|nr:ATP-grasp domain-containing protein [Flavisolibacter sp.]